MNRKLIASTTVAALLALSACSSDDDDDTSPTEAGGGDQTSEPAPEGESEDRDITSDPSGDDTGAIAGLWNAESDGDERYVEISDDGVYTDYDYRGDGADGASEGNCYVVTPMTLDLELAAGDSVPATFSIADGRSFTAAADGDTLDITFVADDSQEGGAPIDTAAQSWTAVDGIATDDLMPCEGETPAGENLLPGEEPGEGQISRPAPGTGPNDPPLIDPAPSETDTSAAAGLWVADGDGPAERIDLRYVLISENGLYTDYDDQQDPFGTGENCYVVTERRLDLETGDPLDGTYSASGLPSFTLVGAGDGGSLTVTPSESDGGSGQPVVWERAGEGITVESLSACEEG